MTYACEHCGFLFSRAGEVSHCPACEDQRVRLGTMEERMALEGLLEKIQQQKNGTRVKEAF